MSLRTEIQADSPARLWEASAGGFTDYSANNAGTKAGVSVTTGQPSLLGDGTGSSVLIGSNGYVNTEFDHAGMLTGMTIVVLFQPNAAVNTTTSKVYGRAGAMSINWGHTNTAYQFAAEAYVGSSRPMKYRSTTPSAGTTYLVMITFDGSNLRAYSATNTTDAALITTVAASGSLFNYGSTTGYIGNAAAGQTQAFPGYVQYAAVLPGAISLTRFQAYATAAFGAGNVTHDASASGTLTLAGTAAAEAPPAPGPVANLTATPGDTTIDVDWPPATYATSYDVTWTAVAVVSDLSASGSLTVTGTVTAGVRRTITASGQITPSGAASARVTHAATASGPLAISGGAEVTRIAQPTAAGALALSGAAQAQQLHQAGATGDLTLTGATDSRHLHAINASGAVALTGAATLGRIHPAAAVGTLALTGDADATVVSGPETHDLAASGSLLLTGDAALQRIGQFAVAGAVELTGLAEVTALKALTASGALTVDGSADLSLVYALTPGTRVPGVAALTYKEGVATLVTANTSAALVTYPAAVAVLTVQGHASAQLTYAEGAATLTYAEGAGSLAERVANAELLVTERV